MKQVAPEQLIQDLMNRFLKAPKEKTPEAIRERLLFWIDRANNAEHLASGKLEIADVRRKARQNVRRIINAYPEIAAQLAADQQKEAA